MANIQQIQNAFLDAAKVISDNSMNNIDNSLVIKGEIIEVLDAAKHQYKVSYGGALYTNVYGIGDTSYAISSIVYVLVPNKKFDDTMWILGGITPTASDYVTESKSDSYISLQDNLFGKLMKEDGEVIDAIYLQSWTDETRNIRFSKEGSFASVFKDYLIKYNTFKFSASIKTSIDINHRGQGQYGLLLMLPFINNKTGQSEIKTYSMTVDNMEGNPYDFREFSKQTFYFKVEDGYTYDDATDFSLYAFVKDFNYVDIKDKGQNDYDIIIKDVSLEIVDVYQETSSGYYLTLVGSDGNYFLQGTYAEEKVLTPILKVNGKTTSIDDWDCYWFVQDISITSNTQSGYHSYGGPGWKCINNRTNITINENNKEIYQYITTDRTLTLTKEDVDCMLRYRCVLVKTFKDESGDNAQEHVVTASATIMIKNLDSRTEVSLETETGSNTVVENVGEVRLIAQIKTTNAIETATSYIGGGDKINSYDIQWMRTDQNGNFIKDEQTIERDGALVVETKPFYNIAKPLYKYKEQKEDVGSNGSSSLITFYYYRMEITFPSSIIDETNTFYATFYKKLSNQQVVNIGTDSVAISISKEAGYILNIINAEVLYKYDSDGDSPMDNVYYDGAESSRVTGTTPFSYQLFKPDGHELTDSEYKTVKYKWWFPKNSLLVIQDDNKEEEIWNNEEYYIIEGYGKKEIQYILDNIYTKTKAKNNTIKLEAVFNEKTFITIANPLLTKDGEIGTNGSKYTAIIYHKIPIGNNKYKKFYYEQEDINGIRRKLHLVYAADKKEWYIHDQDDKKLKLVRNNLNRMGFEIKVFKNSTVLNNINIQQPIQWGIFDFHNHLDERINCFNIGSDGVLNVINNALWSDSNKIPFTIIQCQITIKNEASTDGISNTEIIRAYYPIEVTWIPRYKDTELRIPTLEGGFSDVLYDIDGNNPDYNEETFDFYKEITYDKDGKEQVNTVNYKHNFKCVDNIGESMKNTLGQDLIYTYEWSLGAGEEENRNLKFGNNPSNRDQYSYIIPATKYESNQSINYIKVKYTWNKDTYDNIQKEIDNLVELEKKISTIQDYYRDNKNNMIALSSIFLDIKNWIKKLDNVENGLQTRTAIDYFTDVFNILKDLYSILENFFDYGNKNLGKTNYKYIQNYEDGVNDFLDPYYRQFYLFGTNSTSEATIKQEIGNIRIPGDEILTLLDYSTENNLTKEQKQSIKEYSNKWKNKINALIKILNLIKSRPNLKEDYTYLKEYQRFAEFKHKINIITSSKNFTELHGSDEADFYDSAGNPVASALCIDLFKNGVINIKNRLIPIEIVDNKSVFYYDVRKNENMKLESYSDFQVNFLESLYNIFYSNYVNEEIWTSSCDMTIETLEKYFRKPYEDEKKLYEDLITDSSQANHFIHIKPIHMAQNTTGLGYLNSWDGSRLYIDRENNYILSPIMGAGTVDEATGFTGVVMGLREKNRKIAQKDTSEQRIGLHGLDKGKPSFFLNARDGSAIFGKSGHAQIVIDPARGEKTNNDALLYNSGYWKYTDDDGKPKSYGDDNRNYTGMLINLSAPYIHFGDATGYIYSGHHNEIGSPEPGFYLSDKGLSIGQNFVVYARDEDNHKKGQAKIEQIDSTLANWTLQYHTIIDEKTKKEKNLVGLCSSDKEGIFMHSGSSTIALGISKDSDANCGRIYSGEHFYKDSNANGFYLGRDGMSIGNQFYLSITGTPNITFKDETAYICSGENRTAIDDKQLGFWLSDKGLSIKGTYQNPLFPDDPDKKVNSYFMIRTDQAPIIYSGDHDSITSTYPGFYIGQEGISITGKYKDKDDKYKNRTSQFSIRTDKAPVIYSGYHDELKSTENGFYIGDDGISIHNIFKVRNVQKTLKNGEKAQIGQLFIGNLGGSKYWTIDGKSYDYEYQIIWSGPQVNDIFFEDMLPGVEFLYRARTSKQFPVGKIYRTIRYVSHGERVEEGYNCIDVDDGQRENEKYKVVLESENTYISYNTTNLALETTTNTDIFGEEYTTVDFTNKAGKDQVYIGTDGLRIGNVFGLNIIKDKEGAIFKGTIQANHGIIGKKDSDGNIQGWEISSKGLIGKKSSKTITYKNKKYYSKIIIEANGNVGFGYFDNETDEFVENKKLSNKISEVDGFSWRLYSDGSVNVHSKTSNFGGVRIEEEIINDLPVIHTYYESEHSVSTSRGDGVFQLHCQDEIEAIAKNIMDTYIPDNFNVSVDITTGKGTISKKN